MSSISDVLARIGQLESLTPASIGSPELQALLGTGQQQSTSSSSTSFADALSAATGADNTSGSTGSGNGEAVLTAAESQLGQAEQPPGSNDGPAIATYRTAVAGSQAGEPWCAYFASWAAQQAGEPLGDQGQGLGSVAEITSWAASNGRLLSSSATPQPGDLILFGDRHVGIVESVASNGTITSVEGNVNNAVERATHQPGEATGFVAM